MEQFVRHTVANSELEAFRFVFTDEKKSEMECMFADFLPREFNVFINEVAWGRGGFRQEKSELHLLLDLAFFKSLEDGSCLEFSVLDGLTIELRSYPPISKSLDALHSKNPDEVVGGLRALAASRNISSIPHIAALIQHKQYPVRVAVVRALARYEIRDDILAHLLRTLKDPDENVRSRSCDALVKYGENPAVVDALVAATEDPSTAVDWAARLALRELNVEGYATADLEI